MFALNLLKNNKVVVFVIKMCHNKSKQDFKFSDILLS